MLLVGGNGTLSHLDMVPSQDGLLGAEEEELGGTLCHREREQFGVGVAGTVRGPAALSCTMWNSFSSGVHSSSWETKF